MSAHKLLLDLNSSDGMKTVLKLRLVHIWGSYAPNNPLVICDYCTLWVDEQGVLVQGIAPAELVCHFALILKVNCVYLVGNFHVQTHSSVHSACSHKLNMVLSENTSFHDVTILSPNFCTNSFEFVRFNTLRSLTHSSSHLADVVGVVVAVTGLSCSIMPYGLIPKRKLVIKDESNVLLHITLWGEVARSLDDEELAYLGRSDKVILGVCSLQVTSTTKEGFSCLAHQSFV
ncbi:unnamed protein product [Linum trigynum]|uniref:Replication protein A OB domain-containing protein n=1 Tax=Linum trigynum TaxID=586398 RepID=A0AAV2FYN7_9ROSI